MKWMQFFHQEERKYSYLARPERFNLISQLWKDRNAQLVCVNIGYIESLHQNIKLLRENEEKMQNTINWMDLEIARLELKNELEKHIT